MGLSHERCCELAGAAILRMASVTDGADPATPVPTCGRWTIADLLEHTGSVYRWAAAMVSQRAQERLPRERMDFGLPADPAEYPGWLADGAAAAVEQLRACDPSEPMWAWGWPKAAAFWPRRMVHEVGVHRADAELALGIGVAFDPDVAADGVSELLGNLPHAAYFAPGVRELRGEGEAIGLHATDIGAHWQIHLQPDGFRWARHDDHGHTDGAVEGAVDGDADVEVECDVEVAAPARDLLLALYGRPACVSIGGDAALFDHWIAHSSL